jgi:hypothetical protein
MADLNRIFVMHTTAYVGDANSDGNFELVVSRPAGIFSCFSIPRITMIVKDVVPTSMCSMSAAKE